MLTPAGSMNADRRSWAAALGIAVVVEAALLWLATGLTMVRRRLVPMPGFVARMGETVRRRASLRRIFR